VSAEPDLATLADEELAAVCQHQVVGVESIARLDALVEPLGRVTTFVGNHTTFARTRRRARHRGAAGQRRLSFVGKRTKAHAGDVDGDIKHDRLLRARTDHGFSQAFLAIALDDKARQGSRQDGQVIPVRDLLEQGEPAHAIAPKLGLDVDVIHYLPREDLAATQHIGFTARLRRDGVGPGREGF
jgi:hypothetical protein